MIHIFILKQVRLGYQESSERENAYYLRGMRQILYQIQVRRGKWSDRQIRTCAIRFKIRLIECLIWEC